MPLHLPFVYEYDGTDESVITALTDEWIDSVSMTASAFGWPLNDKITVRFQTTIAPEVQFRHIEAIKSHFDGDQAVILPIKDVATDAGEDFTDFTVTGDTSRLNQTAHPCALKA